MTATDQRLMRHLAVAVVVKLAVLTALWWFYFRSHEVVADSEQTAVHVTGTPSVPGAKP